MDVVLVHKPRGSQGFWYPVQDGEGLRVTKGKGKKLRIQLKCSQVSIFFFFCVQFTNTYFSSFFQPFDKSRIGISAVDLVPEIPVVDKNGFVVEEVIPGDDPYAADVELKLNRYCKRIQFLVTGNFLGLGDYYGVIILDSVNRNRRTAGHNCHFCFT